MPGAQARDVQRNQQRQQGGNIRGGERDAGDFIPPPHILLIIMENM